MSNNENPGQAAPHFILRTLARLHPLLNTLTGGRAFNTMGGVEVCFVSMTGARTGKKRVIPLLHLPYGDCVILVASQTGRPEHPGWYYNLRKHPDIQVKHRGRSMSLRAREVNDAERAELWPICEAAYPDFIQYRARTDREIPIFLCEPVA
jgi:deazaflavin-dependent oxidoreductase (nitroreductase family)